MSAGRVLAAVGLLLVPAIVGVDGRAMLLAAPYAPYELVLGGWLLAKGFTPAGP